MVKACTTRIAPIARCATPQSALSLRRASVASAVIRRLSPAIVKKSSGTTPSAISVSVTSSRSITTTMPQSSTAEVSTGKKPFIVSVWMAKVSAVRR